ncbi:class I SAM-dependent methyltransferase [Kitasatospora sp. P5_F3]
MLAADRLPADAVLTGVDLVGPVGHRSSAATVRLVTASLADWAPGRRYDLITCVHGLHYLGDKLGLLARIADWLGRDGRFAAQFDPESVRHSDGGSLARPVLAALRAAGFEYRARQHLLTLDGGRTVRLPFDYLGADDTAGPNYTGQPGVASYYRPST